MKLETRGSGGGEENLHPTQPPEKKPAGKKPVIVYIMILFIVAFLLMAFSFLMHQRSNTEALGELQHSVSALQEIQATQDENLRLQEELEQLQQQLDEAQLTADQAQEKADALLALYTLQQQFSAGDYDACRQTMQQMQDNGLVDALPEEGVNGVTSPAERYQQLKDSILNA